MDAAAGNEVDRYAHFVNVFMLDREGNRINRRNAQDIFVPLYNHQIPPGAAWTVHYGLELPPDVREAVTVNVKLRYRKLASASSSRPCWRLTRPESQATVQGGGAGSAWAAARSSAAAASSTRPSSK